MNHNPAPQGDNTSPTDILHKIAKEEFDASKMVHFIKDGPKLDNSAIQQLLYILRTKHNMNYRDLLSVYLTLDIALEKGILTKELLDYIKDNPEKIGSGETQEKPEENTSPEPPTQPQANK